MRCSAGSGLGPRCRSRCIRTCCAMAAAMRLPTLATILVRYKPILGTRTSSTRCATRSFRPIDSGISGVNFPLSLSERELPPARSGVPNLQRNTHVVQVTLGRAINPNIGRCVAASVFLSSSRRLSSGTSLPKPCVNQGIQCITGRECDHKFHSERARLLAGSS
jgi:hypothetical protein